MSDDIGTESERNRHRVPRPFGECSWLNPRPARKRVAARLHRSQSSRLHRLRTSGASSCNRTRCCSASDCCAYSHSDRSSPDVRAVAVRSFKRTHDPRTTHERPTNDPRTSHERATNEPRTSIVPPIRRSVHPMTVLTALTALTASTASDLQMPPHPKHSPCSIP